MRDAGYTLVEVLVALMMIGLTVSGLMGAMRVIGLYQSSATGALHKAQRGRQAEAALAGLLQNQGPFSADEGGFTGDSHGFSFDCHEAVLCAARMAEGPHGGAQLVLSDEGHVRALDLADSASAHFLYVGQGGVADQWPRPDAVKDRLRAISLWSAAGDGRPVATVRLWREQAQTCVFDPISRQCRAATP